MLRIKEKIIFFKQSLLVKNGSYSDDIMDEIYEYFFSDIENGYNIENFSFLNSLITNKEIENKISLVVSQIIMHEHHAGVEDLINEYI